MVTCRRPIQNDIDFTNSNTNMRFFIAEVKDIVHPVLYLLSDKADMINGVTLVVDGGRSVA